MKKSICVQIVFTPSKFAIKFLQELWSIPKDAPLAKASWFAARNRNCQL